MSAATIHQLRFYRGRARQHALGYLPVPLAHAAEAHRDLGPLLNLLRWHRAFSTVFHAGSLAVDRATSNSDRRGICE